MKTLIACIAAVLLSGCVVEPLYPPPPYAIEYPPGVIVIDSGYWINGVWYNGPYHGPYYYHGHYFAHYGAIRGYHR